MLDHSNDSLSGIYYHDLLILFFCLPSIILQTIHPVKTQVPYFVTGVLRDTRMTQQRNSPDHLLPQLLLVYMSIILCPAGVGDGWHLGPCSSQVSAPPLACVLLYPVIS